MHNFEYCKNILKSQFSSPFTYMETLQRAVLRILFFLWRLFLIKLSLSLCVCVCVCVPCEVRGLRSARSVTIDR